MLVLVFAGCGGGGTPEAETQVPVDDPAETPPTSEAVHWSADEWVIGGISVFSGSESIDAIADLLGAEARSGGVVGGTSIDADPIIDMAEMAVFIYNHNMFRDIQTARLGVTLMRGIVIGETSIDEVIAMFPVAEDPITRYLFAGFVESGDGGYVWRTRNDDEGLTITFFKLEEDEVVARYNIIFIDDIASGVYFNQELYFTEGATIEPTPEIEPAPEIDAPVLLPDAPEVIDYQLGAAYDNTPFSVNGVEVPLQQFEAQMNQIYAGARYRLVSYRSIRSEDSFVSGASGATDIFMTRSEAVTRLGNETEPWASAYLAVLNVIPTRPVAGMPEFGIGDFVEYGVDSVAIHDITGNGIPDLIFTNVASSTVMTVSFSVYSFDGSAARRIIHIENLESAGVSSPYYHAYFTNDGTLIINNNNTGFGRIHIFRNLGG